MTQNLDNLNALDALVKTGAKSAITKDTPLKTIVGGTILSVDMRQAREYSKDGSGDLKFWKDGNPMMEVVVIVDTENPVDDDDNGHRGFYIKAWGTQKRALTDAVRAAGKSKLSEALAPGGKFYGQVTGTQETKSGYDEKLWAFRVVPASPLDNAFDAPEPEQEAPAAPAQAAPAQSAPAGFPQQDQRPAEKSPQEKARAMKDVGLDTATIASTTGLSVGEIDAL